MVLQKSFFGFEIKGLNISTNNVTLSSCESGIGVYKNRAGISSFSRAFFNSGANQNYS